MLDPTSLFKTSVMEIAILAALILLNGCFAMSEIALVTARRTRLQKLIDEGDSGTAAAVKLGEDPTRFLSTIQIGTWRASSARTTRVFRSSRAASTTSWAWSTRASGWRGECTTLRAPWPISRCSSRCTCPRP